MAHAFSPGLGDSDAFATKEHVAASGVSAAGSADLAAMVGAAAATLGLSGASSLAVYARPRANNFPATRLVVDVLAAIGDASESSEPVIAAADNA